jgi:hypothetical protein
MFKLQAQGREPAGVRLASLPVARRRRIDPDVLAAAAGHLADIALDSAQVAQRMGLSGPDSLATYISRYDDFPEPWIARGRYIKLWLPDQVDEFVAAHQSPSRGRPMGAKPTGDSDEAPS